MYAKKKNLQLAAKVWLRVFGVRNLCKTDGTIDNMASTESFVGSVNKGSRDSAGILIEKNQKKKL